MAINWDFNDTLKGLIDQVEDALKKTTEGDEQYMEWLATFPVKAKQKLLTNTSVFKMPKTPGRKKTRQQNKKRGLNEDEDQLNGHNSNDMPPKKGKLSHEDEELERESLGGRPRRQASKAATSKIQQSLKMVNLKHKLRRPSGEEADDAHNSSSLNESGLKLHPTIPEESTSPVLIKSRKIFGDERAEPVRMEVASPPPVPIEPTPVEAPKVQFASGSSLIDSSESSIYQEPEEVVEVKPEPVASAPAPAVETAVQAEAPKRVRGVRKGKKVEENVVEEKKEEVETAPPRARKTRKAPEPVVETVTLPAEEKESSAVLPASRKTKKTEDTEVPGSLRKKSKESCSTEEDVVGLPIIQKDKADEPAEKEEEACPVPRKEKKTKQVVARKASVESIASVVVEEDKPSAAASETEDAPKRATRTRQLKKAAEPEKPVATSPRQTRLQKAPEPPTSARKDPPSKIPVFTSPASSPARKPFLVFSPFKPSSVKTKVEAFEAVLSSGGSGRGINNSKPMNAVLPEARVLLKRLTDQDLKEAGVEDHQEPEQAIALVEEEREKRGTFVMKEPVKGAERRQSLTQALARKSLDKAKHVAQAVARTKIVNNIVHVEAPESPSVHVNRNATNIISKYRFANTGGSSTGSSSTGSLNRHVAMTQAKGSNIVSGVSTFTTTKQPMQALVTKPSEEEESRRKEQELKRLKEKEEEAARKREELIRAKAEEQRRKLEARAKRAMEQRALRAKQAGEEQKQKLESKEEKAAHLQQKIQTENQEKAERIRAVLVQRQQEAEQRRKAEQEKLQKQREEEEQQRQLALKKEQEEAERQAKAKLEAEKAKAAASAAATAAAAASAAASAAAGPSKMLNTTVTLQSDLSYHITPVRVKKPVNKVYNPDNYDIDDMRSDDSTDDESKPKKVIPSWARSASVKLALAEQAKGLFDIEAIFPKEVLLQDPDLNVIFKHKRARFDKRTSSAVWKTPPAHYM